MDTFRLVPIDSDKFRYAPSNMQPTPYHPTLPQLRTLRTVLRRKWSGGWKEAERLFSAVGEKSVDFLKKLYRLSSDTL